MSLTIETDLEKLGKQALQDVAGAPVSLNVVVETGEDSSGQLAYFFSFVVMNARELDVHSGLFRIKLQQKLRDELIARGDEHYPYVLGLSSPGWKKPANA